MSNAPSAEAALWQQIGKYLQVETAVSDPHPGPGSRSGGTQSQLVLLKVTFSNTAADEPDKPKVVFTGVGLSYVYRGRARATMPTVPKWARFNWRIEKPDHRGRSHRIIGAGADSEWADLTLDESKHGIALFPGDSATLELAIPVADIEKYEFHVEGSVSRRHFFHYDRILDIRQT